MRVRSPIRPDHEPGRGPWGLLVSHWHGDARTVVLNPRIDRPPPAAADVAAELRRLAGIGVERVLTGALHAHELDPFLANGFVPHEHLVLLQHDLTAVPRPGEAVRLRRAWRRDQPAVLDLDNRAFDRFWALDRAGLDDAVAATPVSRFRVAVERRGPVLGYAVTGRSGDRGYLQRLAVDPAHQRHGIGTALVADALAWLARAGARSAVVNTQDENSAALELYERCGFTVEPSGLTVLSWTVTGPSPPAAGRARP